MGFNMEGQKETTKIFSKWIEIDENFQIRKREVQNKVLIDVSDRKGIIIVFDMKEFEFICKFVELISHVKGEIINVIWNGR